MKWFKMIVASVVALACSAVEAGGYPWPPYTTQAPWAVHGFYYGSWPSTQPQVYRYSTTSEPSYYRVPNAYGGYTYGRGVYEIDQWQDVRGTWYFDRRIRWSE